MSDIKPCPFCGNTNLEYTDGTTHRWMYVGCVECGAMRECRKDNYGLHAAEGVNVEKGIRSWNAKRDAYEALQAENAELREALESVYKTRPGPGFLYTSPDHHACIRIAQAALEKHKAAIKMIFGG